MRGEKQILTAPGANLRLGVGDVEAAARFIRSARVTDDPVMQDCAETCRRCADSCDIMAA